MSRTRCETRQILLVMALVAVMLALTAGRNVTAAPVSGNVIGHAAATTSPITKVPCGMRRVCSRGVCASRRVCW
jgi:hypothetical protein